MVGLRATPIHPIDAVYDSAPKWSTSAAFFGPVFATFGTMTRTFPSYLLPVLLLAPVPPTAARAVMVSPLPIARKEAAEIGQAHLHRGGERLARSIRRGAVKRACGKVRFLALNEHRITNRVIAEVPYLLC